MTFLYHNGEILTECDGESAPVRRHIRGIGLSYVQTLGDNAYHAYHQDEQGSTAYITGQGRKTENIYQYDAFGNLIEQKEAVTNRILYTGQQYDQETGQYYLRARYYNPVVGRFLQEDTYRGDGLNLYAYCANNPVVYYDPSGHGTQYRDKVPKTVDTPGAKVGNESQTTRRQAFRDAKEAAGIPKSEQYKTHEYVYDGSSENRTVYEFEVDGKKKYVILHTDDKNGRGQHFHGADDQYGSPFDKGKYNQYEGHFPEDPNGFK